MSNNGYNRHRDKKPNPIEAIMFICLIVLFIALAIHPPETGAMFR